MLLECLVQKWRSDFWWWWFVICACVQGKTAVWGWRRKSGDQMQLCSRARETWTPSLSSSSQTPILETCREQDRYGSVLFTISQTKSFCPFNYIFLTFLSIKQCPRFLLSTQNRSTETGKNTRCVAVLDKAEAIYLFIFNLSFQAIVLFLWFPPLQLLTTDHTYVKTLDIICQNPNQFWIVQVCKYNLPPSSLHSLQRQQPWPFAGKKKKPQSRGGEILLLDV